VLRFSRPSRFLTHRIAPSDAATVYALQYTGLSIDLLRSTDAGFDWELRSSLTGLGCGNGDLAVAPSSASTVYAFGSGPTSSGCNTLSPRVLRSRDGGATFTDVSAGLPAGIVTRASVDPHHPDVVYAEVRAGFEGRSLGIWKTEDGGASWTPTGYLAARRVTALLASAVPDRAYAALLGGGVLRTDDGGETWENVTGSLITLEVHELATHPREPERVYAATTTGVWVLEEP
jgi:photosystem II stability/assembly factor-like uncharacterized protein